MKVHRQLRTMCPIGFELLDVHPKPTMICHVLVVGRQTVLSTPASGPTTSRTGQLGGPFNLFVRPTLDPRGQRRPLGVARLPRAGRPPHHYHLDPRSRRALPDFPRREGHVYSELEAVTRRATFHEQMRYRPAHSRTARSRRTGRGRAVGRSNACDNWRSCLRILLVRRSGTRAVTSRWSSGPGARALSRRRRVFPPRRDAPASLAALCRCGSSSRPWRSMISPACATSSAAPARARPRRVDLCAHDPVEQKPRRCPLTRGAPVSLPGWGPCAKRNETANSPNRGSAAPEPAARCARKKPGTM
jgi:hypothetical protein